MGFSIPVEETARQTMTVRPVGPQDLAAVMGLERRPGFAAFVGRSEEAEHRAMLADPRFAYRLGLAPDGEAIAFAILSGLGDPSGNTGAAFGIDTLPATIILDSSGRIASVRYGAQTVRGLTAALAAAG